MKRTLKMGANVTGVIPTAPYANFRPGFVFEEIIEGTEMTDEEMVARQEVLYNKLLGIFKDAENKALVEAIQRERADLRFHPHPETGAPVPGVTSIIGWDADFFVSQEDLKQYASQSQLVHARVSVFIDKEEWVDPKELKNNWFDIVVVTKGSLKLPLDTGNFPAFLKKYPILDMVNGKRIFDDKQWFTGMPDFHGIPDFKGAENIPTVCDVKRTPDKIKDGMQLAAYCKAMGLEQGMIVPLNAATEQGYSKPKIYSKGDLDGYWTMFKQKRDEFRKRYGV